MPDHSIIFKLQLIPQATNVDRYVAHLRDLLQLADPTTISSIGMPMHNVLENNHIDLILSSSKLINNDIYIHDHELFLELVKGFITSADFSEDYFYFKVSLEIPIPPSNVLMSNSFSRDTVSTKSVFTLPVLTTVTILSFLILLL